MPNLLRNRPLVVTIIVAVILVILVGTTSGDRNASVGESVAGNIFTPIERFFYDLSGSVADFLTGLFSSDDTGKQLAELQRKVEQLELDTQTLKELQHENERLKELLKYKEDNPAYELITAKVIANDSSYWFEMFTINVGRKDGIEVDMIVINSSGLVGRIVSVGGAWSKVMSIIDTRSSVSGILERVRVNGIVRGDLQTSDGENGVCKMLYLPYEVDLQPGDMVLTSGLGGIYPKGLIIGEVFEVTRDTMGMQKHAMIKTSVDFSKLEEVIIIKSIDENDNPEATP